MSATNLSTAKLAAATIDEATVKELSDTNYSNNLAREKHKVQILPENLCP